MSEAPTPSDWAVAQYLDLRDSVRHKRLGHGGREVCEALTASLDKAIEDLVAQLPDHVAIVAIGGYGRRELSPFSDVDLMVLHDLSDPSDVAAGLFRPLWDAKLRVGHAVRTVKEAAAAARERFDTQTTLLTSRLVAGDEDLFHALMEGVTAVTKARPLRRHLVSQERQRRREAPYLLMATDVKEGRGGLRTLQGFEWVRRREGLIGRFSANSSEDEEPAAETLLQVRNALHAVAGRSHDVFSPELREPAARWLGCETFDLAAQLVAALETVDDLATRRWPEVIEERRRGVIARLSGSPPPLSGSKEPSLEEWSWIMQTGEQGRQSFERLWRADLLQDVLPEWDRVRTLPQLAPFHDHPVAAHLWRTVEEMNHLIDGDGHYSRVADELGHRDVLAFAAFLHDIGKGRGGDHAEVGAGIARSFCERLGVPKYERDLIEGAVRHHLLLAMTATRRDIDDPSVIDEIADTLGSLDLLQVVYLLTVADSRATGPSVWNEWKATLVRTLFARCAARFGADQALQAGTSREEVMALVGTDRRAGVLAHLDQMPEDYLRSATAEHVVWHVELIDELGGVSNLGVRADGAMEAAVVVGRSKPFFRLRVAEVMAANGIDVLEARLMTRSDGIVIDSFRVRDDRTGGGVDPEKWERVGQDLEAGLLGRLDTGGKVAARAAAYREVMGGKPVVRGEVDTASGELVITVKCADRIGRLAEILSILGDCGLDIRLAKIDSRAGEIVDTFHVVSQGSDGESIESLEQRLTSAISP